MANPQRENGHIDIAHEIAGALMRTNVSKYQQRILWAIWRKTYGWHKKYDWISNSQLIEMSGLRGSHVSRTIKELEMRNMITRSGRKIGFNKDYQQWRELPKGVRVYDRTHSGETKARSGSELTRSGEHKRNYTKETTQKIGVPSQKATDPRIKNLIRFFADQYRKSYGKPCLISYGRDSKLIKNILKGFNELGHSAEERIRDLIRAFLSPEHQFKGNVDIPSFHRAINRLNADSSTGKQDEKPEWLVDESGSPRFTHEGKVIVRRYRA